MCIFCICRLSWIVIMHVASVKCNLPINIWIWLRLSFALCTGEFIGLSREYFERRIQDKSIPMELTRRPCFFPARVCDWLMLNFLERFRLRLLEGTFQRVINTKFGKLSTKLSMQQWSIFYTMMNIFNENKNLLIVALTVLYASNMPNI